MDYAKFQTDLLHLLAPLVCPFIEYAKTYATNILNSIEESSWMGRTPEEAVKTQLLYVVSNLQGVSSEDMHRIGELSKSYGVDLTEAIQEVLGEDQDEEVSDLE